MKKLTRSRDDRVLFGVCGGIGKYFDVDPVIVRIIFIVLLFTAGTGFLAYIIAIFIIPEEEESYFNKMKSKSTTSNENMGKAEEFITSDADGSEGKNEVNLEVTPQSHEGTGRDISQDNYNSEPDSDGARRSEITGTLIGITLIVFGALFLMRNFSFLDHIYYSIMPLVKKFFWPGLLIGLGALVIYKNK